MWDSRSSKPSCSPLSVLLLHSCCSCLRWYLWGGAYIPHSIRMMGPMSTACGQPPLLLLPVTPASTPGPASDGPSSADWVLALALPGMASLWETQTSPTCGLWDCPPHSSLCGPAGTRQTWWSCTSHQRTTEPRTMGTHAPWGPWRLGRRKPPQAPCLNTHALSWLRAPGKDCLLPGF